MTAERKAFPVNTASRLTGLSVEQLQRWAKTKFFRPFYWTEENEAGGGVLLYSFRDLVGLRAISDLMKEYSISMQHLKDLGHYLREHYNEPWSILDFNVVGRKKGKKEIIFRCPKTGKSFSSKPPGQTVSDEIVSIDMEKVNQQMQGQVIELWRRRPEERGQTRHLRGFMGNARVIAGTRVPTAAIWDFHQAGHTVDEIRREYPQLTEEDIAAAIAAEKTAQALIKKRVG